MDNFTRRMNVLENSVKNLETLTSEPQSIEEILSLANDIPNKEWDIETLRCYNKLGLKSIHGQIPRYVDEKDYFAVRVETEDTSVDSSLLDTTNHHIKNIFNRLFPQDEVEGLLPFPQDYKTSESENACVLRAPRHLRGYFVIRHTTSELGNYYEIGFKGNLNYRHKIAVIQGADAALHETLYHFLRNRRIVGEAIIQCERGYRPSAAFKIAEAKVGLC